MSKEEKQIKNYNRELYVSKVMISRKRIRDDMLIKHFYFIVTASRVALFINMFYDDKVIGSYEVRIAYFTVGY